jgi:hypothetical protein
MTYLKKISITKNARLVSEAEIKNECDLDCLKVKSLLSRLKQFSEHLISNQIKKI